MSKKLCQEINIGGSYSWANSQHKRSPIEIKNERGRQQIYVQTSAGPSWFIPKTFFF